MENPIIVMATIEINASRMYAIVQPLRGKEIKNEGTVSWTSNLYKDYAAQPTAHTPRDTGVPPKRGAWDGAGEGNRTLVFSLEGCCSTIELHPRYAMT